MSEILVTSESPDDASVTVALRGAVEGADAPDLRRVLLDVIMRVRPSRLLIDLRAVTAVDAFAVGTLQAAVELAGDVQLSVAVRMCETVERRGVDGADHAVLARLAHDDLLLATRGCDASSR
ncbi:STAS domain-containing protein [Dactylosporangium cerinum]|uniref:STAS domain-containing protein n=1 Tax=Dactylosporangium cerinum TaxID=1434730 RepID=A0ABV9WJA4_9ACTN